jgi:hypothetical protein
LYHPLLSVLSNFWIFRNIKKEEGRRKKELMKIISLLRSSGSQHRKEWRFYAGCQTLKE